MKQWHEQPTCNTTKGNPSRTLIRHQLLHGGRVGATGELEWTRRSLKAHRPPKLHSRPCRPCTNITTHRSSIQLPERAKSGLTQAGVSMPERAGQLRFSNGMALETTAHRQPLQGYGRSSQTLHKRFKQEVMGWPCVDLQRIRLHREQLFNNKLRSQPMITLLDQAIRASRQAAATSITTLSVNGLTLWDGLGWTNPFTGTRALGRAILRIKPGFAEVNIRPITEAHHQPGAPAKTRLGPIQASTRSAYNRWICSDIDAVNALC